MTRRREFSTRLRRRTRGLRGRWASARTAAGRSKSDAPFSFPELVEKLPVRCIVFSKDRPMQLEACLRSIERFAPYDGSMAAVLYVASTPAFAEAYRLVAADSSAEFAVESRDFQGDVSRLVDDRREHTVFHTDDDVFFRHSPAIAVPTEASACFSLRLGRNTTYSYPTSSAQVVPEVLEQGEILAWDWTRAQHDFAYPLSLDGHVIPTGLLRKLLRRIRFTNPNELEEELVFKRYLAPHWMMSFRQSCLVSIPVNIVSETHANRAGSDPAMAPEALNARFLAGERIDLDSMDFRDVRGAHQEIPLAFTRFSSASSPTQT